LTPIIVQESRLAVTQKKVIAKRGCTYFGSKYANALPCI